MSKQKPKYTLRNIYNDYKENLYVLRTRNVNGKLISVRSFISYTQFRIVVVAYFNMKLDDLMNFGVQNDQKLTLVSGFFGFRKYLQTRSFHVIKDNEESARQGKLVKVKIPILEDHYVKLLWKHKKKGFGKLRIRFSDSIRARKKQLEKEVGLDAFKMAETYKTKK